MDSPLTSTLDTIYGVWGHVIYLLFKWQDSDSWVGHSSIREADSCKKMVPSCVTSVSQTQIWAKPGTYIRRHLFHVNVLLPCQPVGREIQRPRWLGCLGLAGWSLWAHPSCLPHVKATGESWPCRLANCRNPEGKRQHKGLVSLPLIKASLLLAATNNTALTQQQHPKNTDGCWPAWCRAPPCAGLLGEAQYRRLHRSSGQ